MARKNIFTTPDYLQRGEVVEIFTGEGQIVVGVVTEVNRSEHETQVIVLDVFGQRSERALTLSRKETVCVTGELSESAISNYPYREG